MNTWRPGQAWSRPGLLELLCSSAIFMKMADFWVLQIYRVTTAPADISSRHAPRDRRGTANTCTYTHVHTNERTNEQEPTAPLSPISQGQKGQDTVRRHQNQHGAFCLSSPRDLRSLVPQRGLSNQEAIAISTWTPLNHIALSGWGLCLQMSPFVGVYLHRCPYWNGTIFGTIFSLLVFRDSEQKIYIIQTIKEAFCLFITPPPTQWWIIIFYNPFIMIILPRNTRVSLSLAFSLKVTICL